MKHLHAIIIALLGFLLLGCQDQLVLRDDAPLGEITTKASADEYTVQTNNPYVFLAEKDFKAWTDIIGLDNRFKACEVPENTLQSMTTEALVQTVLKYPLNYILFSYDNPEDAVRVIVENSSLHQELKRRADAAELLLDCYLNALPVRGKQTVNKMSGHSVLPLEADYSIGYFLYSDFGLTVKDLNNRERKALLEEKRRIIENCPEQYGTLALKSVQMIESLFGQQRGGVFLENTLINTPFLQTLTGQVFSELDSDEINYLDSLACTNHPAATLIGHSSACYNSHSYAWHSSSTSNQVWLTPFYPSSFYTPYYFQLRKYWTDDLYENCSSANATRVYYYEITSSSTLFHSSVVCSNGMHRSKWGLMPLMEHSPLDFPNYKSTMQIDYYKEKSLPLLNDNISISGPSYVYDNTPATYEITYPTDNHVTYYVTAESLNQGNTISLTPSGSANHYSVTCNGYGAYKIYVRGYAGLNNSYYYSFKEYLVICVP